MDYIIYRKDCKIRPWVRFSDGQIFLTGDRFSADEELKREKKDGEAFIISLRYTPLMGKKYKCTQYLGHKRIGQPFAYTMDEEWDSTDFYNQLEKNLLAIEKSILPLI